MYWPSKSNKGIFCLWKSQTFVFNEKHSAWVCAPPYFGNERKCFPFILSWTRFFCWFLISRFVTWKQTCRSFVCFNTASETVKSLTTALWIQLILTFYSFSFRVQFCQNVTLFSSSVSFVSNQCLCQVLLHLCVLCDQIIFAFVFLVTKAGIW